MACHWEFHIETKQTAETGTGAAEDLEKTWRKCLLGEGAGGTKDDQEDILNRTREGMQPLCNHFTELSAVSPSSHSVRIHAMAAMGLSWRFVRPLQGHLLVCNVPWKVYGPVMEERAGMICANAVSRWKRKGLVRDGIRSPYPYAV